MYYKKYAPPLAVAMFFQRNFFLMLLRMWESLWTKFFDMSKILSKSCMPHVSNLENIAEHLWECHFWSYISAKRKWSCPWTMWEASYKSGVILLVCLIHHLLFIKFTSYDLCFLANLGLNINKNRNKSLISSNSITIIISTCVLIP